MFCLSLFLGRARHQAILTLGTAVDKQEGDDRPCDKVLGSTTNVRTYLASYLWQRRKPVPLLAWVVPAIGLERPCFSLSFLFYMLVSSSLLFSSVSLGAASFVQRFVSMCAHLSPLYSVSCQDALHCVLVPIFSFGLFRRSPLYPAGRSSFLCLPRFVCDEQNQAKTKTKVESVTTQLVSLHDG